MQMTLISDPSPADSILQDIFSEKMHLLIWQSRKAKVSVDLSSPLSKWLHFKVCRSLTLRLLFRQWFRLMRKWRKCDGVNSLFSCAYITYACILCFIIQSPIMQLECAGKYVWNWGVKLVCNHFCNYFDNCSFALWIAPENTTKLLGVCVWRLF